MRRSNAPSQKQKFVVPLLPSNIVSPSVGIKKEKNATCTINKNVTTPHFENQTHPEEKHSEFFKEDGKIIYNVVYGKPSKKKHKTWDGDGLLEINGKSATLKDTEGKVLGVSSKTKLTELVEGSRIFIGSKEVEILDLVCGINSPSNKRVLEEENLQPKIKKICLPKKISKTLQNEQKKNFPFQSNVAPLIMPRPNDSHQWEYNINHEPITDVSVDPTLNKRLRPHQRDGVIFLYRCVTGIRSLNYTGAILADEMGLGKTLQTVTLIWTLLRQGPYGGKALIHKVLIVVPSSLVQNWQNEFLRWITSPRIRLFVVDKKNKSKDFLQSNCPIMIISYEQFVRSIEDIKDIQFDMIVCDEGHRLKNSGIQAANHLSSLPCKRRILLTGTPVQNDLQEYYSLVDFVNPGIFGTPSEFRKNFANAIVASRDAKSSDDVVQDGKEKADELNRFTSGFILRRTQSIIESYLPEKNEYVIFCDPAPFQKHIYELISKIWLERMEDKLYYSDDVNHLSVICTLKKICNHPDLAKANKIEQHIDIFSKAIDEKMAEYTFKETDSGKFLFVMSLLKILNGSGERIVLVSNFTQTLEMFANVFDNYNYKYMKFYGSTTTTKRSEVINTFNSEQTNIYILLLSSKAGGVGLNLIGGSRLVLYDSDWNPAVDLQAMARIWREGQKKNVHLYRLLTTGTIEEKIFQRQLTKAGLNESIIDPSCQSSVKLSKEEIMDLFGYTGDDKCLTHETLKCPCYCDGAIPQIEHVEKDTEEEARDCQLNLVTNNYSMPSLRMNQLFQWEHHGTPIQSSLLQEMKVEETGYKISFVFKNKTN